MMVVGEATTGGHGRGDDDTGNAHGSWCPAVYTQ
jgi:hypothetical protein